jgi:predicted MFS family arabinose efflux permease
LITLSVGVCLSVTTELLPTGLLPGMSRDLDVSEGTLGLLVTAYAVMVAVLAAPLAIATARFARRTLMLAILVGYTVSNLAMVVSSVYAIALGARLVGGVMHGCSGACSAVTSPASSAPTGSVGR